MKMRRVASRWAAKEISSEGKTQQLSSSHHHRHLQIGTRPPDLIQQPGASSSSRPPLILFLVILFSMLLLLNEVAGVVVSQVRFISRTSGREDYALAGDSIELSCLYVMRDEAEDIKQLVWSKDGKNFLRWRKHKHGLEVLSYTFKGHLDPASKHNQLTIHNATIDMHGRYRCSIKTDLGTSEAEHPLVVISHQPACQQWQVHSQPQQCRETFRFDCRHMFPKPVPSCGLWNGRLDKFIRSVMVDISEEEASHGSKQTYRISYQGKFELQGKEAQQELLQFAGHLMFKCDITVPDTSWRLSLVHKMFDFDDGCLEDPLETIERMQRNYSHYASARLQRAHHHQQQLDDYEMLRMLSSSLRLDHLPASAANSSGPELNCWRKPRPGSLVRLNCNSKSAKLVGAHLLECQAGGLGWVPLASLPASQRPVARRPRLWHQRKSRRVLAATVVGGGQPPSSQGASNDLEELAAATGSSSSVVNEFEIIPNNGSSGDNDSLGLAERHPPSPLTPLQLAALLPVCVSAVKTNPVKQVNRLPLKEDLDGLNALGASSHGKASDWISWFNFSSSSAATGTTSGGNHLVMLAITTTCSCWATWRWRHSVSPTSG